MFGALNALVTGLVLAGAIYAAVMQRHQLVLAIHHFDHHTEQNERERSELKKQFDAQMALAQEQLAQVKAHAANENLRAAKEVRREKLEELLLTILKIQQELFETNKTASSKESASFYTVVYESVISLTSAFIRIKLLIQVYFKPFAAELTVAEPFEPYIAYKNVCKNNDTPQAREAHLDNFYTFNNELIKKLSTCFEFGILKFNDIIEASVLEKKL